MLYRPEAFEPLTDEPWDVQRVAAAIRDVVADAEGTYDAGALWPAEEWDSFEAQLPLATLYAGASGMALALDALSRRGYAAGSIDLRAVAARALERWREEPDFAETTESPVLTHASLYFGETGPLLAACRLAPSAELADDLHARVLQNASNEANELMHGAPGTMLAARAMLDWTGEERWADAWRDSAEILWARRDDEGLWMYPPYGRAPGAAHGVGTTVMVMLAGDLLDGERRNELLRDTGEALRRYAVVEGGLANWPMAVEDFPNLVGFDGEIRLQWCHGGAGVVASASQFLDEELLLAGAELVWLAGPPGMEKGPGICHGTAGSGYAFLKTFERTGDERWLKRARRFAVHALGQVERWRARRGAGRYSLWSGDIGAALFAADCVDVRTAVPVVEGL